MAIKAFSNWGLYCMSKAARDNFHAVIAKEEVCVYKNTFLIYIYIYIFISINLRKKKEKRKKENSKLYLFFFFLTETHQITKLCPWSFRH